MLDIPSENFGIYTYIHLLDTCIQSKSLVEGKKIHEHILKNKTHITKTILLDKLTCMYLACGEIDLARSVFDQIPRRNVILWNSMIRGYAWKGPLDQAIGVYYEMLDLGIKPNKFTFPFVLKACSGLKALEIGREIHSYVKRSGLESDVYVCTALVDFYAKCGCLVEAKNLFDQMPQRDVVAWNAMIAGSSLHGFYEDTVQLVFNMQSSGTSPNTSTLVAVLPTIGQAKALSQGKNIHGYSVRKMVFEDVMVATALLDMYGKCGSLDYARRIFDTTSLKNEVTWSAMIGAYVLYDHMREGVETFDQMILDGTVSITPATLGTVLRACSKLADMSKGRQIHGYSIKRGSIVDIMMGNSLLAMYSKGGILDDAFRLFDEMDTKDTVSYSAMISGCVQNGNAKDALDTFRGMQASGINADTATMVGILPACAHLNALQHGRCNHAYLTVRGFASNTSICNALIDMYSKCGRIDFAREVFNRMPKRDIVSWNAIIAGYGIHGRGGEALLLFHNLLNDDPKPDYVTFICLLSACSHSGLIAEGKHWFHVMPQDFNIVPRMEHYICMVDLLGRGGLLDEAYNFILKMPFEPDVRVWGAMLSACRIHENIKMGEEVSKNVQRLGPEGTGNFVLLSNIYSAGGRWDDAANVRIVQKEQGFKKSPGCSWVEITGTVHAFVGGDRSHPLSMKIYEKLDELSVEMKKLGYQADIGFVLQDVEVEEKERSLLYHSEKLAVAFGILSLCPSKPIVVTKNLRICGDCHSAIKLISKITKRAISVRDASRFHHFSDGTCNCEDFW
ncbi:hypothetical protein AQUCO_00201353v1 [Aquilegia coerulea]|uniref:DYW domain-containing protein n=1 Tax=Aquilegia coerulea TaxID=218851 RepID=A0A2G5F7J5_AQUCA|nr:hypothetical protein AQUCO_00201353v1 [Aquilegia coerulea]